MDFVGGVKLENNNNMNSSGGLNNGGGSVLDGVVHALQQEGGPNSNAIMFDGMNVADAAFEALQNREIITPMNGGTHTTTHPNLPSVTQNSGMYSPVQRKGPPPVTQNEDAVEYENQTVETAAVEAAVATGGSPSPVKKNAISRVNGRGMWRSWKRNFKSSLMAVLDLFDNAIDASLVTTEEAYHFKGRGKIHVAGDKVPGGNTTGICMINNCHARIPPIKEVLEIFRSNKGSQDIGENGVGIKQACASLTDLSFIFTRNGKDMSVGVIAEVLQREEGCVLPFITFNSDTTDMQEFSECVTANPEFAECVEIYGDGNLGKGLERLWSKCQKICKGRWEQDHNVFCVLLHKLRHSAAADHDSSSSEGEEEDGSGGVDYYALSAENLMNKLADALPERYIHIPADFDIRVNHQRIRFQYWERRLVDLTSFACTIDPKRDWVGAPDWQNPNNGYKLRIYCGFDPRRVGSVLSLYVYSRHSGRLISYEEDARNTLGLTNSGTEFAQGLTIILDDYLSNLPLTPTKQGLGFAEETADGVHERNLYAWTGAHADIYYKYHKDKFVQKGRLRDAVASRLELIEGLQDRDDVESFMRGKFTEFVGIGWNNYRNKTIRKSRQKFEVVVGPDSRINLIPPPPVPVISNQRKKSTDSVTSTAGRSPLQAAPGHQLMSPPRPVVMSSRRTPSATEAAIAQEEGSFPITQEEEDLIMASTFSEEIRRASLEAAPISRKRPRVEESPTLTASQTASPDTEEPVGDRVEKYKAMYERLNAKFNTSKHKHKEKVAMLKREVAARDETLRKKEEALQEMEYDLSQAREDLSLAEEMKANLRRDVATLEKQNAMLSARLEGRRSSGGGGGGTNIHI